MEIHYDIRTTGKEARNKAIVAVLVTLLIAMVAGSLYLNVGHGHGRSQDGPRKHPLKSVWITTVVNGKPLVGPQSPRLSYLTEASSFSRFARASSSMTPFRFAMIFFASVERLPICSAHS